MLNNSWENNNFVFRLLHKSCFQAEEVFLMLKVEQQRWLTPGSLHPS